MTTLDRPGRQRPPFTVVRVRRIKHRTTLPAAPRVRRETPLADLASLILYGQG
ncbi:MAG TPA: hypothetical protein VHV27_12690 [Phenylobacterium sp.]|jgi:hypothetical protein|nr:hypothetical protein [Phenylobacterium sp.]